MVSKINPQKEYEIRCPLCRKSEGIGYINSTRLAETIKCTVCHHIGLGAAFIHKLPMTDNSLRSTTPMVKTTLTNTPKVPDNERLDLMSELKQRIIGQDHVLEQLTSVFYKWEVGMSSPQTPAGTFLLLGPTGTGKTRTVEALAGILLGSEKNFLKVDCAEFAHSHEIAKLLGSPPGYLGHRETPPALTQAALARHYSEKYKCTLLLFDEIEKASDALWNLLLGILDKATLTLGDNQKVDFSNVFIFMTSNLGAREMQNTLEPSMGFHHRKNHDVTINQTRLDDIALSAAKKRFAPEFMNRIDAKLVYKTLAKADLATILDQLLLLLQHRLNAAKGPGAFELEIGEDVRKFLLSHGVSKEYGARELKRAIELHLSLPLVHLMRDGTFKHTNAVEVTVEHDKCVFKGK